MSLRITLLISAAFSIITLPAPAEIAAEGMTTSTLLDTLRDRHVAYSELLAGDCSVTFLCTFTRKTHDEQTSGSEQPITRYVQQSVAANTSIWDYSDTGDDLSTSSAPLMFSIMQFDWADNPILLDIQWFPKQAQFRSTSNVLNPELLRLGFPSMFTTIAVQRMESAQASENGLMPTLHAVSSTSQTNTFEFKIPESPKLGETVQVTVSNEPFAILKETLSIGSIQPLGILKGRVLTKSERTYSDHGDVQLDTHTHHLPGTIESKELQSFTTGRMDIKTYKRLPSITWETDSAATRFKAANHDMKIFLTNLKEEGFTFSVDKKINLPSDLATFLTRDEQPETP